MLVIRTTYLEVIVFQKLERPRNGSFPVICLYLRFPVLPFLALLIVGSFRNRSIIVKHFSGFYVPDQALVTGDIGIYPLSIPRQWIFISWGLQFFQRNSNLVLMSEQALLYVKNLAGIIIFYSLSSRYFIIIST